jgi:heptosyltransferase-2
MLVLERFIEKKILPFFCMLLSVFKKKRSIPEENKEIAVIRFWGIGETVLVLPMLKALREAKPDSKITLLCTKRNRAVFYGQSFFDEVRIVGTLSIPLLILGSFRKYDLVIDTEPHFAISAILSFFIGKRSIGYDYGTRAKLFDINVHYKDKQHVVQTICDLLKPIGITATPNELVKLKHPDSAKSIVDLRFEKNSIRAGKRLMIGMHAFCGPTGAWRVWPKERFAKLIDRIMEKYDCMVVLTGSGEEAKGNKDIIKMLKNRNRVFNFSNLPLSSLIYLIGHYNLMVSNDTGPMHIAAAQAVPTIGLFGPNLPERFGPFPPERNITIYHKEECSPCINEHLGRVEECPYAGKCMKAITVKEVFEALGKLLKKKSDSNKTKFWLP